MDDQLRVAILSPDRQTNLTLLIALVAYMEAHRDRWTIDPQDSVTESFIKQEVAQFRDVGRLDIESNRASAHVQLRDNSQLSDVGLQLTTFHFLDEATAVRLITEFDCILMCAPIDASDTIQATCTEMLHQLSQSIKHMDSDSPLLYMCMTNIESNPLTWSQPEDIQHISRSVGWRIPNTLPMTWYAVSSVGRFRNQRVNKVIEGHTPYIAQPTEWQPIGIPQIVTALLDYHYQNSDSVRNPHQLQVHIDQHRAYITWQWAENAQNAHLSYQYMQANISGPAYHHTVMRENDEGESIIDLDPSRFGQLEFTLSFDADEDTAITQIYHAPIIEYRVQRRKKRILLSFPDLPSDTIIQMPTIVIGIRAGGIPQSIMDCHRQIRVNGIRTTVSQLREIGIEELHSGECINLFIENRALADRIKFIPTSQVCF